MAEKRKVKRKRDEDFDFDNKKIPKPSKDEIAVAKWLKKNVPVKKTKFAGHNVEYFTGSKAVDALLDSEWSRKKGDKDPFFNTRQDIIHFLNNMLRHKLFHRAKKVPVSEQELKAKMKKKDKKFGEKDDKKRKEEETAESSHAEGKDAEDKTKTGAPDDRQKKCKKIKLEMHFEQMFVDNLDAYVWIYDPIPIYYWVIGAFFVLGGILICLFPLWPPSVRMGVQYLSMAAAGLLILILALAVIRLIIFCIVWLLTCGTLHLWLLPNLTEDVGFFASFWPLYEYKYGKQTDKGKDKKKKKKVKYSDNEDDAGNEKEKKGKKQKSSNDDRSDYEPLDGAYDQVSSFEGDANTEEYDLEENDNRERNDDSDEGDDDTQGDTNDDLEVDTEDDDNLETYDDSKNTKSSKKSPKNSNKDNHPSDKKTKKSKGKASISRNDSEETDTESSSQHSQTGKDFEIIDKEDSDVKS